MISLKSPSAVDDEVLNKRWLQWVNIALFDPITSSLNEKRTFLNVEVIEKYGSKKENQIKIVKIFQHEFLSLLNGHIEPAKEAFC